MRDIARSAALLCTALVLACSGPGTTAPGAATVLRQAGDAMAGLHSVIADVKFGPGVELQGLTVSSATAKIQLPAGSDTVFKLKQGDFLVDLRVIAIGGHVYVRLPFSKFTEVTPDEVRQIPDLSAMFDRRSGLPAVLAAGTQQRYDGTERVTGTDCDKVSTTYSMEQVGQLLGGVKPAGDARSTIWAGQSDHFVRKVILNGPLLEAGKVVQVEVNLHDFNQPVTIATPA